MKLKFGLAIAAVLLSTLCAAQVTDHGEYRQGSVVLGQVGQGERVFVGDKELKVSANGRFVFGIGRDEKNDQRVRVLAPDGVTYTTDIRVLARDYRIQRVNGVPSETVTPPEAQLRRIREEAAQAWGARDINSDLIDFASAFQWPLVGPITGVYGSQRVYNGVPKNPHFGVDVAAPEGTLVVAPAGGVVRLAHNDMFFSGGTLIVDHGHGLTSSFIHLSAILVQEGERIEQGQPIAKVGATGRATGPHLDWRMNWFDVRVDPTSLVGPMPKR